MDELLPLATLDLNTLRATIIEDEGDLILVVDDGEVQIEFSAGLCGKPELAVLGAQQLASTAWKFADRMRRGTLLRAA